MTFNTGNPIGSTDARDRSDNSENLDLAVNSLSPTFVDRLGVTRDTLEGIYQKSAYYRVGTFDAGYTLTNNRQTLAYGNIEYSWSGSFGENGKQVPPSSTPETTGGIGVGAWIDRTQELLRGELAESGSSVLISTVKASDIESGYRNTPLNVISLARMFGAEDGTDITSRLSDAIAFSKNNGYIPIIIDLTAATISGALPQLNGSFDFVSIHGLGKNKTKINISSAGDSVFTLSGGSGGSGGSVLSDLTIIGSSTQKPIKNTGFCGARIKNSYIDCGTAAVLSNDIANGTFTEFFVFDDCELNVNSVFELSTGAGNDSFHGCGLTNRCVVNEKTTSTGLFKVGASTDTTRSAWYNAPLDAQIFKRTSYPIIATINSLSNVITTNGNITLENFTGSPQTFSVIGNASRHIHAGTLNGFNLDVLAGSCVFSNLFSTYPSGVVGNGIADAGFTIKTTTTKSISTGVYDKAGKGRLVSVSVSAGNHEFCVLVFFAGRISPYITPVASIVSTVRSFDAAGFGVPLFSVNNNELIVSNTLWVGAVTVTSVALPCVS